MQHRIETSVIFDTCADIEQVKSLLWAKIEEMHHHRIALIFVPVGSPIVVEVTGNGALLRDVVYALDTAGMLD